MKSHIGRLVLNTGNEDQRRAKSTPRECRGSSIERIRGKDAYTYISREPLLLSYVAKAPCKATMQSSVVLGTRQIGLSIVTNSPQLASPALPGQVQNMRGTERHVPGFGENPASARRNVHTQHTHTCECTGCTHRNINTGRSKRALARPFVYCCVGILTCS